MNVDAWGWVFLVVAGIGAPWAAARSAKALDAMTEPPARMQVVGSVLLSQGVLLGLALLAAWTNGLSLFPPVRVDALRAAAFIIFMTLAMILLIASWSRRSRKSRERLAWIAPSRAGDLPSWGIICIVAGITEEIVFRGVMFELLRRLVGEPLTAGAVCVAAFAASHLVQGLGAVAATAVFAAGFHMVVWITGDLYTAMAIHIAYDFAAGIILMFLARRGAGTPTPSGSP